MVSTEQLIQQLWQEVVDHYDRGQLETFGPETNFFHNGIYSHATSVWSHSLDTPDQPSGPFRVIARPQELCRLVTLPDERFHALTTHFKLAPQGTCQALETLCQHLQSSEPFLSPATSLDGLAAIPMNGSAHHYRYLILFDPLKSLQLYDIAPTLA